MKPRVCLMCCLFAGIVLPLRKGVFYQDYVAQDGRGAGAQAQLRLRELLEEGGCGER